MKKLQILARSNLRLAKGQTAVTIALILLASFMLNLWLMLATDYKQNLKRYHDKLNAEHVTLALDVPLAQSETFFPQILTGDVRTSDYRLDPCMYTKGSFIYNDGEISMSFLILDEETAFHRSIGKTELVEKGTLTSGIYFPMVYKTEDIAVGKTIAVTIGTHTLQYDICGFTNNIMTGSINCGGLCTFVLTPDKYEELESLGYAPASTLVSVRIVDPSLSEDYEAMLNHAVSEEYPGARPSSNTYALISQSRYISQMICSGIVSAMAFFVLLIALVVISSNISNYIRDNMKTLGALKAVGYTTGQLTGVLLTQFCGIALLASLPGIALSYCLFPGVNSMMISQTGIPYKMRFLPLPLLLTLTIACGACALVTFISARRLMRLEPIAALRQGIQTHNFKNNHVPLDRTHAPLNLALSLKTIFSGFKQNVIICITMLVISLVVVFSGLMFKNALVDAAPFIDLIQGETADSSVTIRPELEDTFLQEMNADPCIEKIYLYTSFQIRHANGTGLFLTICDDFSTVNNQQVCVEGRFPKYDNETAIGISYAQEMGLKLGSEITLTAGGQEADYIISGFTQVSNYLGKDCLLTRAGYERLGTLSNPSYNLNLTEETDIDEFNNDISRKYGENITSVMNFSAAINAILRVYVTLITIIVAAILILSIVIITLVLYLLVRTILNHKKKQYGILKALGFTTKQLMLQTAASLMPAVILSTIAGLILCSLIINPLMALFLSSLGIVRCSFELPAGFLFLAGSGLIAFTFGVAFLLSFKIRKITPMALLTGE